VIGRRKDLIIVAGNNLYPEDVEDAVGAVAGIVPGRVVAFGIDDAESGTERVCVVAETAVGGAGERRALKMAVIEAAAWADVTVSRVYLAEPRWLIKSSSGKPGRSANRERALSGLVPE
jgi:fatty-acyl-CoA synthase